MDVLATPLARVRAEAEIAAADEARLAGPARLTPGILHDLVGGNCPLCPSAPGDIAVAPAGGALEGGGAASTQQDFWAAGLRRGRPNRADTLGGGFAGPDTRQRLELPLEALAARVDVHSRRLEVVFAPANAKAQREPPAGERIYAGGLLGKEGGIA